MTSPYGSYDRFQQSQQGSSGSKQALWTTLGVILAVVLILGLSLFVALQALKDATGGVSGNHNGAESLTPADDGYWDRTIDVDDINTLRDSAGDAPVPSVLSDLTSDCYEGTSYFGQSDDDGRDAHWVPTVECMFGDDNEFTAQYTENKEAIAAAESMGLQESIVDFSTARGSIIAGYIQDSDLVIVEVLANGEAVIEYLMLLTEDITGFDYDCMQRLVDAGILDRTPVPPFIDA
ncbi:Uncharacterised protein [Corynebacterium minutissimum]|uniref:Uncharacterized protein n=1 Tax=Corynebacterium minutissimum TaxID=38301 RepID=A0A2X4RUF1_9CORY|nr:Uncharacterised protein [Corynebacterium minutissimum]VEG06013.1 Uncharacterised protein [Corynebacterium minutissimum]